MHRILIVDDHEVVRQGIKRLFDDRPGSAVFGEASTAPGALSLAREQDWDIVVLDLSLAGRSGFDVLQELKQAQPRLPVLVLSMHSEEQYARRAFRAGASGYISKDTRSDELLHAIELVIGGGKYVSPTVTEKLVVELKRGGPGALHESLSAREFEVLRLIASGKTLSEIAELMGLSSKTISTYRSRILEKTGMKTNAELTHYAIDNRLIE
jgi:DNA-binding NarL/FixJ family response regulator